MRNRSEIFVALCVICAATTDFGCATEFLYGSNSIMADLVARRALDLAQDLIDAFGRYSADAQNGTDLQARYIAIVVLLRSVGHVLVTTDCASEPLKGYLAGRWNTWKHEDIFKDFIEPTRNALLKEFSGGLPLRGDEIPTYVSASPGSRTGATISTHLQPEKARDLHGRLVLPLFREALAFWDRRLGEIEAHC